MTLLELKNFLNALSEDKLQSKVWLSDGIGTSTAKSIGFYADGDLYVSSKEATRKATY